MGSNRKIDSYETGKVCWAEVCKWDLWVLCGINQIIFYLFTKVEKNGRNFF